MEVCLEACRPDWRDKPDNGFNPCFNGSVLRSGRPRADRQQVSRVSILVLMEVCLEAVEEVKAGALNRPFQSLF